LLHAALQRQPRALRARLRAAELPSSKTTRTSPVAPTLSTVPAYGATRSHKYRLYI
jgi:hypothetical protein